MPSEKDICIYALQHVGQFAELVDLNEDSTHALVASTAYPFVRDSLLERHTWNFATRSAALAPTDQTTPVGWRVYPLPADCIRLSDVYSKVGRRTPEYQLESVDGVMSIVTPAEDVWVRYIQRVTNTDRFTAGFVEALSWCLAAAIAGPIIKGDTGITVTQKLTQYAASFESKAAGIDANQQRARRYDRAAPWHERPAKDRALGGTPTPMDERGDFER